MQLVKLGPMRLPGNGVTQVVAGFVVSRVVAALTALELALAEQQPVNGQHLVDAPVVERLIFALVAFLVAWKGQGVNQVGIAS